MFGTILHRMIFWELIKVFALSLISITGLFVLAGLVAEASQRGLGPGQLLTVIPLIMPSSLPYTLPATTLFATCVVYGRLAHDNEILAIRAAGINVLGVLWPGLLLGALVSAGTLAMYYELIPNTHHLLRTRVLTDVEEYLYSMLRREGKIKHPKLNWEIYVNRVRGDVLHDAIFMRRDAKTQQYDVIARADEASLDVDLGGRRLHVNMRRCYVISGHSQDRAYVEERPWTLELPDDVVSPGKVRPGSLSWRELVERRRGLRENIDEVDVQIARHREEMARGTAPPHFAQHVEDLRHQKRAVIGTLNGVEVEMHMRPALALGCLCFVLVGCPIGIWFSRSDYLSAFITCFLPIVFLYYPLLLCGVNIGKAGKAPPAISLWAANGLLTFIGLVLFRRLIRH